MQLLDELALLSIESSYDDNKKVVGNFIIFSKSYDSCLLEV